MLRPLSIALFALAATGEHAHAERCEPAVTISGDAEVVHAIEALLRERGIAIADGECTIIRAHVERRGDTFAIGLADDDHAPVERAVGELATAATVIESFVRDDASSLLAVRPPPPRVNVAVVAPRAVMPTTPAPRGVQVFGAAETSIGSDKTNWLGAHVGVCIQLGPICAAARLRFASVVAGEGMWRTEMERRSTELLLGVDVPFSLGRTTLAPGFAAGMGSMHTRSDDGRTGGETGGLRADVHATLSVPVAKRWALDLAIALDLTQETRVESEHAMSLPDEPLALLRFGVGIRYGGFGR